MATETFAGYAQSVPGTSEVNETVERNVEYPAIPTSGQRYRPVKISASCVDAANTRTSHLRPGLILALSSGVGLQYDPTVDAQNEAYGILVDECDLLDPIAGTAKVKQTSLLVGGGARANMLIGLDDLARHQLGRRIIFDDCVQNAEFPYRRSVAKATSYTVLTTDNGTMFHTTGASGAITFTLPTAAAGLYYRFLNTVAQDMVIASAPADQMIILNDLTADSVSAATANEEIGAVFEAYTIYTGAAWKWLVHVKTSGTAITVTTAT